MTPKEFVLEKYPDAICIKVDDGYGISTDGDDYYETHSYSPSRGKSWKLLEERLIQESSRSRSKCPHCGSGNHTSERYMTKLMRVYFMNRCDNCGKLFE